MIELIDDLSKLEGTLYFEFLPGVYIDKHWNEQSVFIDDLAICYIEPILIKHINNYNHYNFMSADKYAWQQIIIDLNFQKETLRTAQNFDEYTSNLSFSFLDNENHFAKDFENSKITLSKMIDDLVRWLRKTLKHNNQISILGI